jgi:hypothetical protein
VHFFPRKNTFRGKFRGISWKNDFSKLFSAENSIFPNIFGGKFSTGKMYEKSALVGTFVHTENAKTTNLVVAKSDFSFS